MDSFSSSALILALPLDYLLGVIIAAASIGYLVTAIFVVARWRIPANPAIGHAPPVTVLKPLCGAEPKLYECLRSFCEQDYPELQVVFGVADASDGAIPVVRRLIAEFPERDLSLVIDGAQHGTNRKVSNLVNMDRGAKHDIVIVSDSDTCVGRDCVATVVAPFAEPATGAVTCLYRGASVGGVVSDMGALFINDWFLASAAVDAGMREVAYCFGPVTAVRRDALAAIGGFGALAGHLADDFLLGRLIDCAGYRVRLAAYLVDIVVAENVRSLIRHELRWARTVRTVKPGEHFLAGVMQPLPLIALLLLPHPGLGGGIVVAAAVLLRIVLHHLVRARFRIPAPPRPWLVPLRECLCFAIWAASFLGSTVRWRQCDFLIGRGGRLIPLHAMPEGTGAAS
ncbi:MAG TPA: bacteriohopanetetrol glucosamine biosynthesis glycosyltransferase HpnI [Stellaceae bacterium]|nr:bacteriohopanetetrol glucosamine biosynthesis glycosyltransferase HpnI [Stellaceae bacterium]